MARRREFVPEEALDQAMRLFWERGYAATSMQDLVERMGVHKRSMYDTFGDKHSLLLQALDRYGETLKEEMADRVAAASGPREALRALVLLAVEHVDRPAGCLAVNSATETGLADDEVARRVSDVFAAEKQLMLEQVRAAQDNGDIAPDRNAEVLAAAIHNGSLGLRVQARTGLGPARLEAMVDELLALLD